MNEYIAYCTFVMSVITIGSPLRAFTVSIVSLTFQYGVGPGDTAHSLLLFVFSLFSFRAGEGSRLLRRLALRFIAFFLVTFVEESIVDGKDIRALPALSVELLLLARGISPSLKLKRPTRLPR